jgi:hypothetical protein
MSEVRHLTVKEIDRAARPHPTVARRLIEQFNPNSTEAGRVLTVVVAECTDADIRLAIQKLKNVVTERQRIRKVKKMSDAYRAGTLSDYERKLYESVILKGI